MLLQADMDTAVRRNADMTVSIRILEWFLSTVIECQGYDLSLTASHFEYVKGVIGCQHIHGASSASSTRFGPRSSLRVK